jgi:hypothetical protein
VVRVQASSLEGKALTTVLEQLNALGLNPLLEWVRNPRLLTGTVISVTPSGQLAAGSTVIVTVAVQSVGQAAGTKSGKTATKTGSSAGGSSGSGGSGGSGSGGGLLPLPGIGIGIGLGL